MNYPRLRCFVRSAAIWMWLGSLVFSTGAYAEEIAKGQVIDEVICAANAAQSYALYVPTSYDATRPSPVLYCFDPGAHGKIPVERFAAAAEKYGYIVAGSNNSRNGPWPENAAAISALVADVGKRFRLDPRRVYVAGLSGGAHVACQVGTSGFAKGVIACSAGFPQNATPNRVAFPLFGTAGTDDFNYTEMVTLDRDLEGRSATHRVVIFPGGHEWLPSELATEALGWLELQAMRAGTRAKDDALIQSLWQARVATLPTTPPLDVFRGVKSLAVDFKGFVDITNEEKRARELGGSREVKAALKTEREMEERESFFLGDLGEAVADGSTAGIARRAAEVRTLAEAPNDSPERRMARRVIAGFASTGREAVRQWMDARDYEHAAPMLELMTVLRPGRNDTLYDLARARGFLGDRKAAVSALDRAVAAGFNDGPRAQEDAAFVKFRADSGFQAAVAKMKP